MIKPIWAFAGIALLGTAGAVGAVIGTSSGGEEEVVQQVETATPTKGAAKDPRTTPTGTPRPSAGPGETLYRWANLELLIPDGSGMAAGPGAGAISLVNHDFVLVKGEREDSRITSTVVIDGDTGAIVEEQVLEQHRQELDRVLATLRVGSFDRTNAPWPYNGEPSLDLVRERAGGVRYMRPSPSTGLYVGGGIGDPGGEFTSIRNERSVAFVQRTPTTGEIVLDSTLVVEEDKPVFERWLATVRSEEAS